MESNSKIKWMSCVDGGDGGPLVVGMDYGGGGDGRIIRNKHHLQLTTVSL